MRRRCRTLPLCHRYCRPGDWAWGQAPGTFIAFIELSGDIGPQKANRFENWEKLIFCPDFYVMIIKKISFPQKLVTKTLAHFAGSLIIG